MGTDLDLGRRAVACGRFRWMAGMLTQHGERVCRVLRYGNLEIDELEGRCHGDHTECLERLLTVRPDDGGPRIPDLSDPATLGCLLALVREAWGEPCAYAWPNKRGDFWQVYKRTSQAENAAIGTGGATEAEALVAALEAAP